MDKNIKHYLVQSSYLKFHCFVFCEVIDLKNKKATILNAQSYLAEENKMSVGKKAGDDLDSSVFGDLARLKAIPLTFKPKRNSWTSFINECDLDDIEILKALSQEPRKVRKIYGDKLFKLKKYDKEMSWNNNSLIQVDLKDYEGKFNSEFEKLMPPLIKKILIGKDGWSYWKNRWNFVIFCRDMAFPKNITNDLARKYFSEKPRNDKLKNNYEHFVRCKILDSVYNNQNKYIFPSLKEFINGGFEVTEEDKVFFKTRLYK